MLLRQKLFDTIGEEKIKEKLKKYIINVLTGGDEELLWEIYEDDRLEKRGIWNTYAYFVWTCDDCWYVTADIDSLVKLFHMNYYKIEFPGESSVPIKEILED